MTGTDTGVGKTRVACALLRAFAASGHSVVGMKPVGAGIENGRYADVDALAAASTVQAQASLVNPYAFELPIAPHIAASLSGVTINLDIIEGAYRALAALADIVIVEGAGGFVIPLNATETSADLARKLALPVVLVVGMRLGCLNHALLTRRAIADYGLECAGWICNAIDAQMLHVEQNRQALIERLDTPLIGTIPHLDDPRPAVCAPHLDLQALKGGPLG